MSEVRTIARGYSTDALYIVETDQETLTGDGTTGDPVRSLAGDVVFQAADVSPDGVLVGSAVTAIASAPTFGLASVENGVAGGVAVPWIVGLVAVVGANRQLTIRSTGTLRLTAAEWDAVTGGSGGLALETTYYLSPSVVGGLTPTKPVASGTWVVQVGVAINGTDLVLSLPAIPTENP